MVPIRNDSIYLGLPKAISSNRWEMFRYVKEKIWNRLQSWKGTTLSRGGKEILIKSVVQSIPSYVASVFLLPKKLCEDIEALMNRFWWLSGVDKSKRIRWMAWNKMCYPKKYGGMGFKRIQEFNVAMLGKHAWRILIEPNSFIARLLKARYFPRYKFEEARLGNNLSYVWQSIMSAQQLVYNGSVKRIGRGETVNIWKNLWLPNFNHTKISTLVTQGLEDAMVSSLMMSDNLEWDLNILRDLFNKNDVQQILKILLRCSRTEDFWMWIEREKCEYLFKSAYRRMCQDWYGMPTSGINFNWHKVWKLSVPPKVKNFIWRALQSCLPTLENLRSKYVEVYPICPVCQNSLENTEHALFFCYFAQNCWNLAKVEGNFNSDMSIQDIMKELFQVKSSKEMEIICSVVWQVWSHKNNVVWNKKFQFPSMVVNGASSFLFQWQRAQINQVAVNKLNDREGVLVWKKPNPGWLSCNVDAAVFERGGKISFRCVLRNDQGQFVAGYGGYWAGIVNPKHAEALAFKEALSWLKKKRISRVHIELDSLAVVQAFGSKKMDSSYLGSIIEDCHSIVKELGSYSMYFIRRSTNSVAHALARETGFMTECKEWFDVPSFLIDVLSLDLI